MTELLVKNMQHFSDITKLYDYQISVLDRLHQHQNTLAIIPTGGGKSLIYQLMALELSGVTIVISPLLALMEEQVEELNTKRNIKALALNSNLSFEDQRHILRNLDTGFKLIYVSPERLQNPFFRASLLASGLKISMIVVDEAHCISQWGSSFRPDYSQIKVFNYFLFENGHQPLTLCLTATLSLAAREDIAKEFEIKEFNVITFDIIRQNLKLHFKEVQTEDEKLPCLETFLQEYKPVKTIGYLYSKQKCEDYAEKLSAKYRTAFYHAGLDPVDKEKSYKNFVNNKLDMLFATTAFGMGINIPDIDSVIHLQIPNSVEEYYQQVGRGWRKKDVAKDCQCLLIWSETNFDRRYKEILREKFTIDYLHEAYNSLLGQPSVSLGQIVNIDKDKLNNSDYNLQLVKYKLENHGIIKTIGEINGSPLTIELHKNTKLWKQVIAAAKDGMDSFGYVSDYLQVSIKEIMTHLFEQDLKGNIKKIPAMKKDVYFEILNTEIDITKSERIVSEINAEIDFRLVGLTELKELIKSENPTEKLNQLLS